MDQKEDDEECEEADTEHYFEIRIVIEHRNGASVFAPLSAALESSSFCFAVVVAAVGIGGGSDSAPSDSSSVSRHFFFFGWAITESAIN